MVPRNLILRTALILALGALPAFAQITPSDDAYTNTSSPGANFGAKTLLDVQSASQNAYIRFDLSPLPVDYTGSDIAKASLKLYVNTVPTAGSFNVDFVNGTWTEKKITANMAPALGATVAASIPLGSANVKDYIVIEVTSAVQAWLNGTQINDGLALIANSPLSATFDSKESTSQSHPPELDIVFASSGGGSITGINTMAGSGLIGGGTSGTLNLSLTNACSANQVLKWSGSAWGCANLSGSGTVTSVGMSAPSSEFTVTGSPITTSGTLGLNWTVAPTSASTANAIVKRDSTGSFNSAAINASVSTDANLSTTIAGFQLGATKETFGVFGFAASQFGVGVFGRGVGFSAMSSKYAPVDGTGVWGDTSGSGGSGVYGSTDDGNALYGINSSATSYTLQIYNDSLTGPLFFAANGRGKGCSIDGAGNLRCSGSIAGGAHSLRIDHPLDPGHKYLQHAAIESSEVLNMYTGNAQLDADGEASVQFPAWFDAINTDFRYQLTAVGVPAPNLYVAKEIESGVFRIAGGTPGMKVSWQVTCIRSDAYMKAHPMVVEEEKSASDVLYYAHPELYGQPPEKGIGSPEQTALRTKLVESTQH